MYSFTNDRKLLKTNIYFGRAQRTLTTSISAPTGPPNKTQKTVFMKVWQRRLGPKFKKNKLTRILEAYYFQTIV